MPVFESTDQLYGVMGALFDRIKETPELADGLLEGKMVVRFHWNDPDGEATIDLRSSPIEYTLGPCELDHVGRTIVWSRGQVGVVGQEEQVRQTGAMLEQLPHRHR